MNFYQRSTALKVSAVALSVLLASCGGGGGGAAVAPTTTTAPTTTPDTGGAENPPVVDIVTPAGPSTIDVTNASLVTEATKAAAGITARSGAGFSFPDITMQGDNVSMTIPGGSLPRFPARRTVSDGPGQIIGFGDPVTLKYDMFAWSTGELVESSNLFDEAITVRGGVTDEFPIPEYLSKSLVGRKLGDTIQVVFPVGIPDLPAYLDANDAYVLLVELL
jgi:hypothetical protein